MKTHITAKKTALIFALSLPFTMANALPVIYEFGATINYSDGSLSGIDVGTTFTGQFSYNSEMSPDTLTGSMAQYRSHQGTPSLSANINGHYINSNNLLIQVFNDNEGNIQDLLGISGIAPQVDGTELSSGNFNFSIASWYNNRDALSTNSSLPIDLDLDDFDAPFWNGGQLMRDGSANGTIFQYEINSLTRITPAGDLTPNNVPEPGTLASLLLGLGILAGNRRIRH